MVQVTSDRIKREHSPIMEHVILTSQQKLERDQEFKERMERERKRERQRIERGRKRLERMTDASRRQKFP